MQRIAILSLSGTNSQHNCVYGFVTCLLNDGYYVDFFMPAHFQNNFGIIDEKLSFIQPDNHPYLLSLSLAYRKLHKVAPYDLTIFLDNSSLKLFPFLKNNTVLSAYFQLEITDRKYCKTKTDKLLKYYERYAIPRVTHLITQDLWRGAYVAGEFRISTKKIVIIPNSPIEIQNKSKSDYIRKKYNVPPHKKIVGYIGMIDEYTLPEWLLDQLSINQNFCFFFHTHISNHPYLKKIKPRLEKVAILSANFLPSNELKNIYASLDIGLAIGDYSKLENKFTSANQDLAGHSYGKINWYLAMGIPVIYTPKMSFTYLKNSGSGLPITAQSNIMSVLENISENYKVFSGNCRQYFNGHLSFREAFSTAINQLLHQNDQ